MAGCADDHPETTATREAVTESLASDYPNVGTLTDEGFVPCFDLLSGDEGGYSHWLNPECIGDDTVLDAERPESVLVDDRWWRPVGAMLIGTEDGEPLDTPPAEDPGFDVPAAPDEDDLSWGTLPDDVVRRTGAAEWVADLPDD